MTFGALLVQARHGEAAGWLHDFMAVRVVALHTIHAAFDHGMMLGETKLRVNIEMALETGARIFAGIDDEAAASATHFNVFARRTVAGFTAGDVCELDVVFVQLAVGTGGEEARDVGVALDAGSIADVICALDMGRGNNGAADRGAGHENGGEKQKHSKQEEYSSRW